jgi:hypothetical protein
MNVTSYIIDNGKTGGNNITDSIIPIDIIGEYSLDIIGGNCNSISEYILSDNTGDAGDAGDTDDEIIGGVLLTKTNESECINGSNICSSKKVINLISKFINTKNIDGDVLTGGDVISSNDEDVINKAAEKLNCTSESCILQNPKFVNFVTEVTGSTDIIKYELYKNFKTKGPRNNTNLLSNYNIDETLIRWSREFKNFYPCRFSMIDFKHTNNDFNKTNLANIISGKSFFIDPIDGRHNGPFNTYACVLNTDVSTGRGKHWVCMFVDCRSNLWTIEYFNSSGNPPCLDIIEWMEKQRSKVLKIHNNVDTINVTNIVHQKSNTECGMYVLYYIRSRLDGISYNYFLDKRIVDSDVTKFRKHVFRKK